MDTYSHHIEQTAELSADPSAVFAHLDDHRTIAAHMSGGSGMMMGGSMTYRYDAAEGRAEGSTIRMEGRVAGFRLSVREVVAERDPPRRKVWHTEGPQRLVVMSAYRMGFDIAPTEAGTRLRVFCDYRLPKAPLGRLLGWLLAATYARWCVGRIVQGAEAALRPVAPHRENGT